MDENTLAELQSGRRLCGLGHYAEAVRRLEPLVKEHASHLEICLQLAEVFVTQGYYSRALDVLDTVLLQPSSPDIQYLPAVRVFWHYVSMVVTGRFISRMKEAKTIYDNFQSDSETVRTSHTVVLLETFYYKIILLGCQVRVLDPASIDFWPSRKLEPLFNQALQNSDFHDAYRLARCYAMTPNLSENVRLLRVLLQDSNTPPLVGAQTQLCLAERLYSLDDKSEQHQRGLDQLFSSAKKSLDTLGHAHGSLDVSMMEIGRSSAISQDVEDNIMSIVKRYDGLDFPAGCQDMLGRVLTIAERLHMFDLQAQVTQIYEDLARKTGSKLLSLMRKVQTMAHWAHTAGHDGKIIVGVKDLYEEIQDSDCIFLRGLLAHVAVQVCLGIGDLQKAKLWCDICHQAWAQCSPLDASNANRLGLIVWLSSSPTLDELQDRTVSVLQMVDEDAKNNLPSNAIEKLEALLLQVIRTVEYGEKYEALATPLQTKLEALLQQLSEESRSTKLANFFQLQALSLKHQGENRKDLDCEDAALAALEKAIVLYLDNRHFYEAANSRQLTALIQYKKFKKLLPEHAKSQHYLDQAIELYTLAKDAFVAMGSTLQIDSTTYWIALCGYESWIRGQLSSGIALEQLLAAERCKDERRSEISVLKGLEAVVTKQRMTSDKHVQDVYRFALQICLIDETSLTTWNWVQKSKARSLSDLLGLGVLVPRRLFDKLSEQKSTMELLKTEESLLQKLNDAAPSDRFQLRAQLQKHQRHMKTDMLLEELMDLREGVPLSLDKLRQFSRDSSTNPTAKRLAFVDWAVLGDRILLLIVRAEGDPIIRDTKIRLTTVKAWVQSYLESTTGRESSLGEDDDEENPLRLLDGLIQPLAEHSDPDEILVLCPTSYLHSLPLHALHVLHNGTHIPLIERNPIVYCASLTTFTQSCRRAAENAHSPMVAKDILAVYEPSAAGEEFDVKEQEAIYTSVAIMAKTIRANHLCGSSVTSEAFRERVAESQMIQFFGHCEFERTAATEQALLLSDGAGSTVRFTMQEFFSLQMQAPHISLLACESASQNISIGDEPLGLVTALLCAGASSVLGTLWRVQSRFARDFATRFYEKMKDAPGTDVFDLAVEVQNVVLDMKYDPETRQPAAWAAFILHGSFFSRPLR